MNLTKENVLDYKYVEFSGVQQESFINTDRESIYSNVADAICTVLVTDLESYNKNMNTDYTLEDDEILIYANRKAFNYDEFEVFDYDFKIKEQVNEFMGNGNSAANVASGYFIVVKDEEILDDIYRLQKEAYGNSSSNLYNYYGFDIDASESDIEQYYNALIERFAATDISCDVECKTVSYEGFIALYGGFLFIGIFLRVFYLLWQQS